MTPPTDLTPYYRSKNILVTGATGSIGSELVRQLLECQPTVLRIFSNDENGLVMLEQSLGPRPNVRYLVGDVRDKERLRRAVEDIDLVFHAAALKHVPACEYNPLEAVKTNVIGTQNVIDVSLEEDVQRVLTISTDKAVNPRSVMGATKLLAERLTISANFGRGRRNTKLSCIRFGNVLNSRGSIMRIFDSQLQQGGPVTVTEPGMVRYIISLRRAVELTLKISPAAEGGEIFVLKMSAVTVKDLAEAIIELLAPRYGRKPEDVRIDIVGARKGEKICEELMTDYESLIARHQEEYYVIPPHVDGEAPAMTPYRLQVSPAPRIQTITKSEITSLCREEGLV